MNQSRSIDHLVLAVGHLDDAAQCYEALGFTLTPRAQHDDRMGTSNRIAQMAGRNFIELLEVDRPDTLDPHDFSASPPHFSFGAHNHNFVRRRDGISMLVFSSTNNRADADAFRKSGIGSYDVFEFERHATLPDGGQVTLAFSLTFATTPAMPQIAFFTCHNKTPEHFWKPVFQSHPSGAQRIATVYLVSEEPPQHEDFLTNLTGAPAQQIPGGLSFRCGDEELLIVTPSRLRETAPACYFDLSDGPQLAGFAIETTASGPTVTPAGEACGAFIEWRRV